MPTMLTPGLADEYSRLFDGMHVRPERETSVRQIYKRLSASEARRMYDAVENATGVPWFVVAIIHDLEAGGRFERHLHNGDPLRARTVRVPAGRPAADPQAGVGAPYSWVESAVDALGAKGLGRMDAGGWSVADVAFVLERYNGFGYRNNYPWVKSPYLWSFSDVYGHGKYVADRKFSNSAVSDQCGGMVLLKHMCDADPAVRAKVSPAAVAPDTSPESETGPSPQLPDDEGTRDWPSPTVAYPDVYLSLGARGANVERVQARLKDVGAAPLITGIFDEVTSLAVKLFQARSADEAGAPLEIDGVVGPTTWAALFGPGSVARPVLPPPAPGPANLVDHVLDVALEQLGVMERPPGSNRGAEVEAFLASVGVGVGNAWCMAFVYWVHREAAQRLVGGRNRVPRTGLVQAAWMRSQHLPEIDVVTRAEAVADPTRVRPGMVFFLAFGKGTGHCGIVVSNTRGRLTTVEGNTNNNGSREGIGVFRREGRSVSGKSLLGFVGYA